MKKCIWFYRLILVFFSCLILAEAATATTKALPALRFAPLPMENREAIYKQFEPVRKYLEQITKRKVVFKYFDKYSYLLEDFIDGNIDIAYLGPLPYVELQKKYPNVTPLVTFRETSGQSGYTCSLIALSENNFDLSTITQKKIALTQPLSTCGYLSVNGLLQKHGSDLEANNYRYLERHDAVALAVVRAEFDIGGVKTAIARKYQHLGLQILEETETLPGFALVSNTTTVTTELAATIRKAFTTLEPTGKDKEMLSNWGKKLANGTVPAIDAHYDIIRQLIGDIVIPEKNNCQ